MNAEAGIDCKPHVLMDLYSRNLEAMKIEYLPKVTSGPQSIRVFEIGVGSDGVVHYVGISARWLSRRAQSCSVDQIPSQLKALDWYRHAWREAFLQLMLRLDVYACGFLRWRRLENVFSAAAFDHQNSNFEAMGKLFDLERRQTADTRLLRRLPAVLLRPLSAVILWLSSRIDSSNA